LHEQGFKVTKAHDKCRLFRQLIMSWSLDPETEDVLNLWDDYHLIMEEPFDIYTMRDCKRNNMRHIMGK
jgi:hypothetical protein